MSFARRLAWIMVGSFLLAGLFALLFVLDVLRTYAGGGQ